MRAAGLPGEDALGFVEAITYCPSNYAKFSGRASRSEYWYFILGLMIASAVATVVDIIIERSIFSPIVSLGTIVPLIALATRRLHDTDRSGWWQLLAIVPLIGEIVVIVWLASGGTPGPNRFGDGTEVGERLRSLGTA